MDDVSFEVALHFLKSTDPLFCNIVIKSKIILSFGFNLDGVLYVFESMSYFVGKTEYRNIGKS